MTKVSSSTPTDAAAMAGWYRRAGNPCCSQLGPRRLRRSGPEDASELAEATGANGASLARLLRALTRVGIFAEDTSGRYVQTPLSEALRADDPPARHADSAGHGV